MGKWCIVIVGLEQENKDYIRIRFQGFGPDNRFFQATTDDIPMEDLRGASYDDLAMHQAVAAKLGIDQDDMKQFLSGGKADAGAAVEAAK